MKRTITRRNLLSSAAAVAVGSRWVFGQEAGSRPLRILLRGHWQRISIADTSQTAGCVALLEKHLPDAEVTLWSPAMDDPNELMLRRRFSKLNFVTGTIDPKTRKPQGPELTAALTACDIVLHNSAPFVISTDALDAARDLHKPFGVLGVTLGAIDERLNALLSNADFIYAGDTSSLELARKVKVQSPLMDFAPDVAFACDVRDDASADTFLKANNLERGKFLCCVPRLRYTPFRKQFSDAEVARRTAVSREFAEPDHAKMRQAIVDWVTRTGGKVLVCPEMTYQLQIIDELVIAPLPPAIKKHVVRRETFWLPNEAASVFARAAAVLSFELHSVILALAAGVPGIHVSLPTEGSESQVLRDIGLRDWLLPIDDVTGEQIAGRVAALGSDGAATRKQIDQAMAVVSKRHATAIAQIAAVAKPKPPS